MISFKKIFAPLTIFFFMTAMLPPEPAVALTVKKERELADEFMEAVFDFYNVLDDPMIHSYINDLGKRLTAVVPVQPFEFRFYVIEEKTFNAFAGPGGHIFVFSGLIEAMESESELAGIMAHEIAHVSARHISDMVENSKKTSLVSAAGLIAGILMGLGGASAVGSALGIGSLAAGQTMTLAYTRENEVQADMMGRRYLTSAGYDLHGLLSALKTIRSREWFGEEEIPTYLKTHPATSERISRIESAIAGKDKTESGNSYRFDRIRMRILALYSPGANSVDRLAQMAEQKPENPAVQYGYGLALSKSGQPEAAVSQLKRALSLKPEDSYIRIALGQAAFRSGDYGEADRIFKQIDNIEKYGPEGLFYLGRIKMATNDFSGAIEAFEVLLKEHPDHHQTLYFLGQSYGELTKLGEAHYYLGRFYYKNEDLRNARFHFNRSLKHISDPEKKRRLEEMLENLEEKKPSPSENKTGIYPSGFTPDRNGKISWKTSPDPGMKNEGRLYNRTSSTTVP